MSGSAWLRVVAIGGACLVLVQSFISDFPLKPRQEAGYVLLVVAVGAVMLALVFMLPDEYRALRRHRDLLAPLGLLVLAEAICGWLLLLPAIAAILSPSWKLRVLGLSTALSAYGVISIALNVAYGAWVTTLIIGVARQDKADCLAALAGVRRWFWRVFGIDLVGICAMFGLLIVGLPLAAAAMPLGLLLIGVGTIVLNLATAAVLPLAMDTQRGFWDALRGGVWLSWQLKGLWWKPVLAQLVLLGFFTLIHVEYSDEGKGRFERKDKTNFAVNAMWTGAYEDDCHWYGNLMESLDAPKLEFVSTALSLGFGVLAIAVKLRITSIALGGDGEAEPLPSDEPPTVANVWPGTQSAVSPPAGQEI